MKQNEKIQTRKDEVRFKTSDIRRIIGKYLAANVLRTCCLLYTSSKVLKLQALAERGEKGEAINARRLLDKLLAKYGITPGSVELWGTGCLLYTSNSYNLSRIIVHKILVPCAQNICR